MLTALIDSELRLNVEIELTKLIQESNGILIGCVDLPDCVKKKEKEEEEEEKGKEKEEEGGGAAGEEAEGYC